MGAGEVEIDPLLGRSPAVLRLREAVRDAAHQSSVLIAGEAGAGHQSVASAIHRASPRAAAPLLFMQQDALEASDALIERARGGTLVVEETSRLAPALLNELGAKSRAADVALLLICAGNATEFDPHGLFTVHLPPLRERRDDLALLATDFIERSAREAIRASHDALRFIQSQDWPGNLAELTMVLRRALDDATGPILSSDFLRRALKHQRIDPPASVLQGTPLTQTDWTSFVGERIAVGGGALYAEAMTEMERHLLREVLAHTGGNQARAARLLGITRTSLRKKIHHLGIDVARLAVLR